MVKYLIKQRQGSLVNIWSSCSFKTYRTSWNWLVGIIKQLDRVDEIKDVK